MEHHRNFVRLCAVLCLLLNVNRALGDGPKIVIVGAGASGIAAASKLLENGLNDVTILEAQDRIGGRIYTTKLGDYLVDLGGQWVYGQKGNVAYELAWPLGLLELPSNDRKTMDFISSDGSRLLTKDQSKNLTEFFFKTIEDDLSAYTDPNKKIESTGDVSRNMLNAYLKDHPDLEPLKSTLLHFFELLVELMDASMSWDDTAFGHDEFLLDGEYIINWKEKGYSTILDILMKKLPDPTKELPVMEKTKLNTEVDKIDYFDPNGKIKVHTKTGETFDADHVIVTPSLGVLKAKKDTLFHPALPEDKQKFIENFGFGTIGRVLLIFDNPWWNTGESSPYELHIVWTDKDREERKNDPTRMWQLSVIGITKVEHKSNLLCMWIAGKGSIEMEKMPEDELMKQLDEILSIYGKEYNVTKPTKILRSQWHSNEHFLGTYSYTSMDAVKNNANNHTNFLQPIPPEGKPRVQFAGEATEKNYYGTVHGAISSGWREANRLLDLYGKTKSS